MAATVHTDIVTVAALLAAEIGPALKAATVMPALCKIVPFEPGSDSKKLRKRGSFTATAASENTNHAISTYQQSTPNTLLVAQKKVYFELSDKVVKWSGLGLPEPVEEAVAACAQAIDTDAMALFDGFSQSVGTGGQDNSPLVLAEATYLLEAGNAPGPYAYVLHPKQLWDVKEDVVASTATIWSNPAFVQILNGQPATNGYKGMYFDVPIFVSTNIELINSSVDYSGACLSLQRGLAMGDGGPVEIETDRLLRQGSTAASITCWYDFKEYYDTCGVKIVSKVA